MISVFFDFKNQKQSKDKVMSMTERIVQLLSYGQPPQEVYVMGKFNVPLVPTTGRPTNYSHWRKCAHTCSGLPGVGPPATSRRECWPPRAFLGRRAS